jgi:hypothetical protein
MPQPLNDWYTSIMISIVYPNMMISIVALVFISRLESEIKPQPELKEIAKAKMQQLMTLVRYTGVSITYFIIF